MYSVQCRPINRGEGCKFSSCSSTFGGPPSLKNIKYTRMQHFKKLNSKIFFPDRPCENVFFGPPVVLDISGSVI